MAPRKHRRGPRPVSDYAPAIKALVSQSDLRKLRAIGADQAKALRKCCGGVAREWATRFSAAVRKGGGVNGVPSFGPRSPAANIIHGTVWGGGHVLARPGRESWVAFWMKGGSQFIGFKDLSPQAVFFSDTLQTAEHRSLRRGERAFLKRRLGSAYATVRHGISRPARNVIPPLADAIAADYGPNLISRLNKETAKILKKHEKGRRK